jgi:hypothetical protein
MSNLPVNNITHCAGCQKILYCNICADDTTKKKAKVESLAKKKYKPKDPADHKPKGRPKGSVPKNKLTDEQRKERVRLSRLKKKVESLSETQRQELFNATLNV